MDTTKIRFGEAVAGAAAILLFIVMFLPWYSYSVKGGSALGISASVSHDAWQAYTVVDLILLLTIAVAIAMVLLSMTQRSTALPISANVAVTILGGLSVLLILIRIFSKPDYCRGGVCASDVLDIGLKYGIFLGLILAAAIAVGGFLAMREEGTSFGDAAQRLQGAGGAAPPPPPPPQGQPPGSAPPQAPASGPPASEGPSAPPPSPPPPSSG